MMVHIILEWNLEIHLDYNISNFSEFKVFFALFKIFSWPGDVRAF